MSRSGWLLAAGLASVLGPAAQAAAFQVLYDLPVSHEGTVPLVAGSDGALYGTLGGDKTASNTGAVFRLAPPSPGQTAWAFSTLYEFHGKPNHTGDGADPNALVMDKAGHLFGTTSVGGQYGIGTAFELVTPAGGGVPWTKITLYDRYSNAVGYPTGQIYQNSSGALFGLADEGYQGSHPAHAAQAAYRLAPPSSGNGPWIFTVLYAFEKGEGAEDFGVTRGQDGALYGGGAKWRLIPPAIEGTAWRYEELYASFAQFEPALDRSLNIYVADGGNSYGTVYRVSPPRPGHSSWTRTDLYAFKNFNDGRSPSYTLTQGPDGSLYGITTAGGGSAGEVFRLTSRDGGTTYPWNKVELHAFSRGADGGVPDSALLRVVQNGKVILFGTTSVGGAHGFGTVFKVTP